MYASGLSDVGSLLRDFVAGDGCSGGSSVATSIGTVGLLATGSSTRHRLELLRCFERSAGPRWRAAPCPCDDILFEPNGAGAKPRNGFGEVRPPCVTCCGSLRHAKQFRHLSQSQELQ
jgi:hypothetical protein